MRLSVIGSWHQACVLCACFSHMGHTVTGIVDDSALAAQLSQGRAPLFEPGLDELLDQNVRAHRLAFTAWSREAVAGADFVFLAIDTPVGPNDESDLSPIFDAVEQITRHASSSFVLCVTAQVPVGTCAAIRREVGSKRPDLDIPVAYVPEFLRLGTAIRSLQEADRFVIGADDAEIARRVSTLYEPLGRPIYRTTVSTAEMAKHASNVFLATSISFINEIADLCEVVQADVTNVAEILKLDRRIGPHAFLNAGIGYAGGTLGRDIQTLRRLGEAHQVDTNLITSVDLVNSRRLIRVVSHIAQVLSGVTGQRIAVWGLTYKPGTSTLRRSAALQVIKLLHERGALVTGFDPLVRPAEVPAKPPFEVSTNPIEAVRDASAVVLMAPWSDIDDLDFRAVARAMKRPVLIDTGNVLSPQRMAAAGFEYFGVGR